MRALVVLWLVAACGDNGLMLEIEPGTSDVKSVEVFITDAQKGNHMGLPMATTRTNGAVWEVVDHVTAPVTGGSASILLMPGSLTGAPTILVVGYDGNHDVIRYAQLPAVSFPHTHSDTIKIPLAPIVEVPAAGSTAGAPTGPKLVRWSKTPDDNTGNCIAVLTDNGNGRYGGDFFGPGDDMDCDQANPECDDNWYLKTPAANTGSGSGSAPENPFCARDDKTTAETMDACRVGITTACTDNVGDCNVALQQPPICVPAAVCEKCTDQIDPSCAMEAFTADSNPYVECDLPVGPGASDPATTTLCGTTAETTTLSLTGNIGGPFTIVTAEFGQPPMLMGVSPDLPLAGGTTTTLHVTVPQQPALGLVFTAENGGTPGIDPSLPDTTALLVIGVHGGVSRALIVPFVVHYVNDCQQQTSCKLNIGTRNGQSFNDPIWHCAGT